MPTEGEVWIGGRMASELGRVLVPPHRRDMAMVFQDLALWPNLMALQNVVLGLAGSDLPSAVGAPPKLSKPPGLETWHVDDRIHCLVGNSNVSRWHGS